MDDETSSGESTALSMSRPKSPLALYLLAIAREIHPELRWRVEDDLEDMFRVVLSTEDHRVVAVRASQKMSCVVVHADAEPPGPWSMRLVEAMRRYLYEVYVVGDRQLLWKKKLAESRETPMGAIDRD